MDILLALTVGTLCIACFFIGVKTGQQAQRGETIEIPSLNPMKAIREREERMATKAEQDKVEAILNNIDSYDGTGYGQKDVPR